MPRKKQPELMFQQHIAAYLVREHQYGVLEQSEITDTEHCIAEDHIWAFLKATLTAYHKSLIHECVTGQRRIIEADVQRAAAQSRFDNSCSKG